jgi:hypothetical protein
MNPPLLKRAVKEVWFVKRLATNWDFSKYRNKYCYLVIDFTTLADGSKVRVGRFEADISMMPKHLGCAKRIAYQGALRFR